MSSAVELSAPEGVEVGAVEGALRQLWHEAATTTRACMSNLVVACAGDADVAGLTGTIARVTEVFPSRVVVVCAEPDAPRQDPRAWISTYCRLAPSQAGRICSEQITLRAGGAAAAQLPSAVRTLLLADLPVIVWWRAAGPCSPDFLDGADQVLVDSGRTPGLHGITDLSMSIRQHPRVGFSDLAWERLANWREQLARFFDPPARRGYPAAIDRVEVTFVAGPEAGPSSEALLLVGWLAAALEWEPAGPNRFTSGSGPVEVVFRPTRPPAGGQEIGSLREVSLAAGRAHSPASFVVWRDEAAASLRAREDTEKTCGIPWCVPVEPADLGALVLRAVQGPERDALFESSVLRAAALGTP